MRTDLTRDELLDRLQARVAQLEAEQARRARRRLPRPALLLVLAVFLFALVPLPLLAANPFTDLTGGVHDADIDAIYNAGVTRGCVPDQQYCPTANVTREELASFLARLGGLGSNPPVAHAKTAQTADTATNATTVGGYAPRDLVSVSRNQPNLIDQPTSVASTPFGLDAVAINAPGPGYVVVTAIVLFRYSPSAQPTEGFCTAQISIRDSQPLGTNLPPSGFVTIPRSAGAVQTSSTTYSFRVPGAGTREYWLDVAADTGCGVEAYFPRLTAIYIPFGYVDGNTPVGVP